MDLVATIMEYEDGTLDDNDTLVLFSDLIETGLINSLQGHYGRLAAFLIGSGCLTPEGVVTEFGRQVADGDVEL